ncbi:MAG TPA: hypothetical protein VN614_09795 [Rhodanobacter sp.]|jgi:hypothetical protein|nr:hypothetical protein [Rhodanobacter sp.]
MSEIGVFLHALGTEPSASLPGNGLQDLAGARYLRLRRDDVPGLTDVFQVARVPREGASGNRVYLQPGQLDLKYDQCVPARASRASLWAYRRSQLRTPTGYLVLATLVTALVGAGIDGSLAIGKSGTILIHCSTAMLSVLAAVSMTCKILAAVFAFLLAIWFRK